MEADPEEIQYESVYREKPLRVRGGLEPAHLSLALPRRLMRDLRCVLEKDGPDCLIDRHPAILGRTSLRVRQPEASTRRGALGAAQQELRCRRREP